MTSVIFNPDGSVNPGSVNKTLFLKATLTHTLQKTVDLKIGDQTVSVQNECLRDALGIELENGLLWRVMRDRVNTLTDRIRKLMTRETALEGLCGTLRAQSEALLTSIGVVEKAGGDATSLRAQHDALAPKLEAGDKEWSGLQEEMRLVREALKWADYAHEGLHWLNFAGPELVRFDAAKAAQGVR